MLFFGRIHPDKGPVAAIEAAARAGWPIVLAGIVQDEPYFEAEIVPRLDGDRVRFVGSVGSEERAALLGGARALLHLIDFDEPFGFSVVEAMASGTPVVAFDRGSMRELVDHGVTGFVVDDVDGAVAALADVDGLDRARIRTEAVRRFDRSRMVDEYLAVYEQVRRRA